MSYSKFIIEVGKTEQERLIADLTEIGFEAFQQTDDSLITYVDEKFTASQRQRFLRVLENFRGDVRLKSEKIIADRNWNADWEKSIEPQLIGRFLVRPTWSDKATDSDQIGLQIDPEMAFGTGYHASTRLMLRLLPDVIEPGHRVLDAGTGSGILAIAAVKLGASGVFAFDKDLWSIRSARKNCSINGVKQQVEIRHGTQQVVDKSFKYDVILANIQRNIIIKMLPMFVTSLAPRGHLLLSGLLKSEKSLMISQLSDHGLKFKDTAQEDEWMAIKATK